jgi:hypothetical protein
VELFVNARLKLLYTLAIILIFRLWKAHVVKLAKFLS